MMFYTLIFALVLGCLSLLLVGRDVRAQLASRRSLYLVTLVAVPLMSLALYAILGSSPDLRILDRIQQLSTQNAAGIAPTQEQRDELMEAMRRRAEQSDSPDYWFLIANQYMAEGSYEQAAESFRRAAELAPEDVTIKAEQAQATFLAAGNRLTEQVQALITEVRAVDPGNVTVNGLLGIAAYQVGEWQLAINFWGRALESLPPTSADAQAISASIDSARAMLAEEGGVAEAPAGGAAITIDLSLDSSVQVDPQTTVFVFARPTEGAAMPIAVKRLTVADLPAQVSLSDADAMVETLQLSGFASVDVVARISFGGTPTATPGDYEARAEDVQPGANPELSLVIRDQLP